MLCGGKQNERIKKLAKVLKHAEEGQKTEQEVTWAKMSMSRLEVMLSKVKKADTKVFFLQMQHIKRALVVIFLRLIIQ